MVALCLLGMVRPLAAEDISFTAEVNTKKIPLGSAVTLTLKIDGTQNVNPLNLPNLEGLDIQYLGPSRNITIVNGKYSSSISFKYALSPLKTGVYTIPPLVLTLDNQTYRTDAIEIEVTDGVAPGGLPGSQLTMEDKIFLRLTVSKDQVFMNEKIPVKIYLFVNNLAVRDIQFPPSIEGVGFTMDDFEQPRQYQQVLDGVRYDIMEFETMAYPTRTGEVVIGPAEVSANILIKNTNRRRSIFNDDFFGGLFDSHQRRAVTLKSESVKVNVLDLPTEGRPKDFNGAVGNFNFEASVGPSQVGVGDPITLKMKIQGEGNLDAVQFPKITDEENFKFYDPVIKEEGNAKILEQVIIPRSDQISEVPALNFSYYNINLKKYLTIKKGPFPITVKELESGNGLSVVGLTDVVQQVAPEQLGQDIVFIKLQPGTIRPSGYVMHRSLKFIGCLILILLLVIGLTIHYRWTHKLETDVKYAKKLSAPRYAKKGLAQAKTHLDAQNQEAFYDAISKTLQDYFSNKLHISIGAVSVKEIKSRLKPFDQQDVFLENVQKLFEECDMIRFASVKISEDQMRETFERLRQVIDTGERRLR